VTDRFHAEGRLAWSSRYRDVLPLKLGLSDRIRLLRALGTADRLSIDVEKIEKLAAARNESILAHGKRNIGKPELKAIRSAATALLDTVDSTLGAREGGNTAHRLQRLGIAPLVHRIGKSV
jgi:hypothetical protein